MEQGTNNQLREAGTMKNITVDVKSQYGTERIYPREYAQQIRQLTGKATIRREDLGAWESLGFAFSTPNSERL